MRDTKGKDKKRQDGLLPREERLYYSPAANKVSRWQKQDPWKTTVQHPVQGTGEGKMAAILLSCPALPCPALLLQADPGLQ